MARLSEIAYTYSEYAPYPAEGKTASTWEQVRQARLMGFLTETEYDAVAAAAGPAGDRH